MHIHPLYFSNLPQDLKVSIISQLPVQEIFQNIALLNKDFYQLSLSQSLCQKEIIILSDIDNTEGIKFAEQFFKKFGSWHGALKNYFLMIQKGFVVAVNELITHEQARWIGQFQNGLLNGSGQILYEGNEERGDFKDSQLHGRGKRITATGLVEKGEFENGKLHGQGKRFVPKKSKMEGKFANGYAIDVTYDNKIYRGLFDLNMSGQGSMTLFTGITLNGEFIKGDWKSS